MRRSLVAALDERQTQMVVNRIRQECQARRIEEDEATSATTFVVTGGLQGDSYGLPEYCAAVLFGRDPAFRDLWQGIKRDDRL